MIETYWVLLRWRTHPKINTTWGTHNALAPSNDRRPHWSINTIAKRGNSASDSPGKDTSVGSNSVGCFKSWGCFYVVFLCLSSFGFRRPVVILAWVVRIVLPTFTVNFSSNRICWIHHDTFGCIWYPSYWGNMPMWNDVFPIVSQFQRRMFGLSARHHTGPGGSEGHRRFDPSKRAPAGDFAVFLYWTNGVAGKHGKIRPFQEYIAKKNFRVQAWFSWWRQHYHGA